MKINTRLIPITPYYLFCKQAYDNIDSIRATRDGVQNFFPLQFGGLFGQKNILDLHEALEVTEFDGAEHVKPGKVAKYVGRE